MVRLKPGYFSVPGLIFSTAGAYIAPNLVAALVLVALRFGPQQLAGISEQWMLMLNIIVGVGTLLIVWWLLKQKQYNPIKQLGLKDRPDINTFKLAVVGYVVYFFSVLVLFAVLSIFLSEDILNANQDIGFEVINRNLIELLPIFITLTVVAPIVEEVLFRGYLFSGLRTKLAFWPATIISSVLFAVAHGQINVAIDVFLMSIACCWLLENTKSLYAPLVLHSIKNLVAFFVVFVYI